MKITIEGLNQHEQEVAKQLLVDALLEFAQRRDEGYVERRYASHDAAFKARKAVAVEARNALANKLVRAVFDLERGPSFPVPHMFKPTEPGSETCQVCGKYRIYEKFHGKPEIGTARRRAAAELGLLTRRGNPK